MAKHALARTLLIGACALAFTAPAWAQTAAEDDADREIVVTAQNREQNLNDVPIAIDVVNAEKLREAGFADMNDIDKIAPVVQLNQDQGTVKITVRGVGTNDGGEAQDTSVVVNIDGEYINRPNVMSMALFDMDRVEVLRGPQGTLYGRNSTGGAINFITRKPGSEFEANGSVSYGNYNAIRADAGVSVPLGTGGSSAVRIAGFYEERDGYIKYPAGGGFAFFPAFAAGRTDDNKAYGGRISLRLDPSDQLKIRFAAEYANRTYTPATFAYADLNSGGRGPTGPGCNANGFTRVGTTFPETVSVNGVPTTFQRTLCIPSGTNFLQSVDRSNYAAPAFGVGLIKQDTWAIRGSIAYEISDAATLTYIGGFRSFSGDPGNKLTLPVIYQSFTFQDEARTQSHELRLNGELGGGIVYQIGGFYFKEKLDREPAFFIRPIGANGSFLTYFGRYINSDSKSVFGQVEVPLGETLTAVGGLRYTDNKRKALYINGSPFLTWNAAGTAIIPGPPNPALFGTGSARKDVNAINAQRLNLGSSENAVTWLVGLNYKPNADTLVFAKASKGFKGGGFDAVGEYNPETNTAFELGWKQTLGRHQLNFGAFYYDYRDLQVSVLLNTTVGGQVFNAGKARIWGLEASGDFKLGDNTSLNVSVNFLDAEYRELTATYNVFCVNDTPPTNCGFNGAPGASGNGNFAGNTPPFSPKWILTAGLEHVFDLGGAGSITARGDITYKDAYYGSFYNFADSRQKGYSQTDLSLEWKPENERFSVTAFVRNLENTRPLTFAGFVSAGGDDIFNWQFGTPRTFGARLGFDF